MEIVQTDRAPAAIGPYSQAVKTSGLLFASGQIPLTAAGEIVEGGIEAQTNQVFSNIEALLASEGLSLANVAKTTVFLRNLSDFAAMNAIYEAEFGNHKPARSTIQVAGLPKDALVEIEIVAELT